MDIEDFNKLWSKSTEDVTEIRDYWDYRAEEFNNDVFKVEEGQKYSTVIDFLISKGMLSKDMEVLDIGCGAGKYSTQFSKQVRKVTAIDISSKMIQFAKENSKIIGATNTKYLLMPWADIDLDKLKWVKKYDLVFVSNCPGINNSEALMKMINACKGFCFLSCFANRTDKIKDEFNRVVLGQSTNSRGKDKAYYIFNILWKLGLYPEICYKNFKWESQWTLEEEIKICSLQYGKNIKSGTELKKKGDEYLAKVAQNGIIKEITTSKIAWIYWKTK